MITNKKLKQINDDTETSFRNVKVDVNYLTNLIRRNELRAENFERQVLSQLESMESRFRELANNGVVASIKKLNTEVFKDKKDLSNFNYFYGVAQVSFNGIKHALPKEATLSGKVDAIVAHLGIDIEVQPEKITASTIKVTTKSVNKKKAGKK